MPNFHILYLNFFYVLVTVFSVRIALLCLNCCFMHNEVAQLHDVEALASYPEASAEHPPSTEPVEMVEITVVSSTQECDAVGSNDSPVIAVAKVFSRAE